jgi:hypothetical protein
MCNSGHVHEELPIEGEERAPLYLIGIRLDPDISTPQLYTLYIDDDAPISREGRPIVFTRPEKASAAFRAAGCNVERFQPVPDAVHAVFDFAEALYVLNCKDIVDATLIHCVNLLLDFVDLCPDEMPPQYRKALHDLADHLTFSEHLSAFLEESGHSRQLLTDAMYWCLGALVYRTHVVT